jgi:hypothetical protein
MLGVDWGISSGISPSVGPGRHACINPAVIQGESACSNDEQQQIKQGNGHFALPGHAWVGERNPRNLKAAAHMAASQGCSSEKMMTEHRGDSKGRGANQRRIHEARARSRRTGGRRRRAGAGPPLSVVPFLGPSACALRLGPFSCSHSNEKNCLNARHPLPATARRQVHR